MTPNRQKIESMRKAGLNVSPKPKPDSHYLASIERELKELNRKKEHELYLEREDLAIVRVLTEWLNRV